MGKVNRKNWKSWRDIKEWAEAEGYKHLAARMQLNNDCWQSSGEFGRSQVAICDALRFCEERNLKLTAEVMDEQFSENYGLY